ncbi:MAG TPA: putative cobaltochelatase [Pirellulales bacterium]|jgi:magnesium chelatase subunit D|nr:putative cobaltochelatase [Pirellulales bacterium]
MTFPFSALVGQEQLKTALLVAAVDPRIGGVLICGETGTAKSTAARALAALCPPINVVAGCPFHCDPDAPWLDCPHCSTLEQRTAVKIPMPRVDLPLGATEDRVLGTLDLEQAMREGRKALQPGLLAAAHRGILYIDEVNLLADHLVDVLLDSAAMGVNSVQREGIELTHPARFVLIGTMNPEEGELRPQLLDRFGLMVEVAGPPEPDLRAEVVRRRLAFEESPLEFSARWSSAQTLLRERVVAAGRLLGQIRLDDDLLAMISRLCAELGVDGLRGDIVLYKTSRALAALDGRTLVTAADVRAAAELVLPHRRRSRPSRKPVANQPLPDELFKPPGDSPPAPSTSSAQPRSGPGKENSPELGAHDQSEAEENPQTPDASRAGDETRLFPLPPPTPLRPIKIERAGVSPRAARGRRSTAVAQPSGHYVRATADEAPTDIALDATLRAAAQRGAWNNGRLEIERGDLRQKQRFARTGALILFVVDASGSMAARRRMEAVKGTVLSLLVDAYQQRDQVAVIAIRGAQSQILLPPTDSLDLAEGVLQSLPTGGRTPLAHGLTLAGETIRRARQSDATRSLLMVLLTDGKANVCLPESSGDPFRQALEAAEQLAAERLPALVLDTDSGFVRVGRTQELATALAAEYLPLDELSSQSLLREVRQRRRALTVKAHAR